MGQARWDARKSWSSVAWLPIPVGSSLGCCWHWDVPWPLSPPRPCRGAHREGMTLPSPLPQQGPGTVRPLAPSPGSTPSHGVTVPLGPPWGCCGAECGVSRLSPHCTLSLPTVMQPPSPLPSHTPGQWAHCSPITVLLISPTLPIGSSLPLKVPDECGGERHFGLRKDTRSGSPVCG